ncbi:MAG TPA: TolC family protein [Candidatus Binatia bacterium]|jgi:cobalt-zinc-cadmium efflux system outer membrane protein|nr:TolC family protein [Candidatus Binatia bacterium]
MSGPNSPLQVESCGLALACVPGKKTATRNPQPAALLCGLGALLLVGCVHFHSQPLSPTETAASLEARSLTNAGLRVFFEKNLHGDLTHWPPTAWDLDMLTLAAFYYNPNLEVARADWRVAAGGIETAQERPNPTVTVSGLHEPVPDAPAPWIPSVLFDLPIETAGKRRLRTEQARHLAESARLNLASTAWQVRSQLRAGLVDFIAARQRLAILQHQVSLREDLVSRLQSQLQAGAISTIELNSARLALIRARADQADAQRLLGEARPKLAGALGVSARAVDGLEFEFELAAPRGVEELTTAEIRRLALLGRADILGALADYAASQSALQLEAAKQYPDIHLAPGYSWNAGSVGEHDWQIGATVDLPILNRHHGPIAEAAARREASAARFRALQVKVIGEFDSAIASLRASQTNAAALTVLLAAATALQISTQQQFRAGAVDQLEMLASELELNSAEQARLEGQVKLQQAVGALEDAVQRPFELPQEIFESKRTDAR